MQPKHPILESILYTLLLQTLPFTLNPLPYTLYPLSSTLPFNLKPQTTKLQLVGGVSGQNLGNFFFGAFWSI